MGAAAETGAGVSVELYPWAPIISFLVSPTTRVKPLSRHRKFPQRLRDPRCLEGVGLWCRAGRDALIEGHGRQQALNTMRQDRSEKQQVSQDQAWPEISQRAQGRLGPFLFSQSLS